MIMSFSDNKSLFLVFYFLCKSMVSISFSPPFLPHFQLSYALICFLRLGTCYSHSKTSCLNKTCTFKATVNIITKLRNSFLSLFCILRPVIYDFGYNCKVLCFITQQLYSCLFSDEVPLVRCCSHSCLRS